MKSCCFAGHVSPRDETWLARTDVVSVNWDRLPRHIKVHYRSYELYSINTIQPLHRSDDLHETVCLLWHMQAVGFEIGIGMLMHGH